MIVRLYVKILVVLLNFKILQGFQGWQSSGALLKSNRIFKSLLFSTWVKVPVRRIKELGAINPNKKLLEPEVIEKAGPPEPENGDLAVAWENDHLGEVFLFILKSGLIGTFTGLSVVWFKSGIAAMSALFYEDLANLLPKPYFYWPIVLYPLIGSMLVSLLVYWKGESIRKGIDSIARSIDSTDYAWNRKKEIITSVETFAQNITTAEERVNEVYNVTISTPQPAVEIPVGIYPRIDISDTKPVLDDYNPAFDPWNQVVRLLGAIATLGSGCSLGPEGPSVEIGAGWSRLISFFGSNPRECRHLFLAGTAAGVAAGFNAPIAGVFFALECGNRYLSKNTVKLNEYSPDGPRADIAAIVTAAGLADIVVGLGLHESNALSIQGNDYAMVSPFFELPLYMGLGIVSGGISVIFTKLRNIFTELFIGENW
eukprot:CAMPEP_0173134198 /NCGR_PEP_ID=MMETSP1105-20130129/1155_1 /TAXON_ID=2985 /ORGANISM="Ochromonas sp., Strain BG-1" /LENGTH=426 /DNA_ID=CAMNT_0014045963 /DNA_START=40 /DNA_END=1317 /DNA_ORIENTATION=+